MPDQSSSVAHSTAAVDPAPIFEHDDDVCEVRACRNYGLHVRFFDGVEGDVEMRDLIFSDRAGVFADLRDPASFASVRVEMGAVAWANGLDLAPDAMHDEIARNGVWVLR